MLPGPATRVVLLPEYRTTPPVRLSREDTPPPPPGGPPSAFDVQHERSVLAEVEARRDTETAAAGEALLATIESFSEPAERLARPGVSSEDLRLAVAMVGSDGPAALEFATSVAQLRQLGFPAEVVCGALIDSESLEAAASRCLSSG